MSKKEAKNNKNIFNDISGLTGIDKEIVIPIAKEQKEKRWKTQQYKRSGHLVDQILKTSYNKDNQLTLFDSLNDTTKIKIKENGIEGKLVVEGIRNLSASEHKLIDAICNLLGKKSQITDATKEDYYTGNIGYDLIPWGEHNNKEKVPKLSVSIYELTKEYTTNKNIGGKDVENVMDILTKLSNKRFLLRYTATIRGKNGSRKEIKIEKYSPLLDITHFNITKYNSKNVKTNEKKETIIQLNPIFRHQIETKYINYPIDITDRTQKAYGSKYVSSITYMLRDYLLRELSSKRYNPEITMERLYYILAEKWMKEGRKKKVKEDTEKALETMKKLGLLISYEIKKGVYGEDKIIFTLNKDFE